VAQKGTKPALGDLLGLEPCSLLPTLSLQSRIHLYLFYGPDSMSKEPSDLRGGVVDILRPNQILNTEQYSSNQQKISQLRELASKMEQTNEEAHQRYNRTRTQATR